MNREQFIKMISIDEQGHYPFSLFVEDKNGHVTVGALALGSVEQVYLEVLKHVMESPEKIYFTLDFPAIREIKTDFVAVYFKEKGLDWESVIIPYNKQGNRLELIRSGDMFVRLLDQCKRVCTPVIKVRTVQARDN